VKELSETHLIRKSKRGQRFEKNPFIELAITSTKAGVRKMTNTNGTRMMIVNEGTGEIVAPAGFWQYQEVDKTQFVKLYVNGVKAFKDLSSAGTKVFELLYIKVQEQIGKDQLWLTFPSVDQEMTPISETTFYRGMKELLEKSFIAESTTPGLYFLNLDFLWNGDRLAFVKEYRKVSMAPPKSVSVDTKTIDMFEESKAISTTQEH